ncbi:MAG: TonB-dependent receptor [Pseudoxanthomonas sp.]
MLNSPLTRAIRQSLFASSLVTTALFANTAYAQDSAPKSGDTDTLDRIVVTGSKIKRTDLETSQPVFTMSREDIQAQGLTSVGDVIQNLTAQGSSLNTTYNNGGTGETTVSLRNLGSNRTLVLVNGKRWVGGTGGLSSRVDLNTIPTAAVERIEVLKDGASSIYGSDAIAGVVNVILRNNYEGAEANAYIGQFQQGDGKRQSYDFTVGSSSDRWSSMLGVGYVKEDAVGAGDRRISAVPKFGATPGFGGSSTSPDGKFCINDPVTFTCSQPDGQAGSFTPTGTGTFRRNLGTADNYNFAPDNFLITPQERISLFSNATLDITPNLRFKALGTYNERRSSLLLASNPIVLGVPNGDDTVISAQSIYNPYGQDITSIQRRPTESGGRLFAANVGTTAFDLGFEGSLTFGEKTFDWDAGYVYGRSLENDVTTGLFQISHLQNALGPSFRDASGKPLCGTPGNVIEGCVPIDFLSGAGTITPEMLNYVSFTAHDQFEYKLKNYYASIGGELFDLPGGPFAFSLGLEHRTESGFDSPDALINAGDTTGSARTATKGGFSVDEGYLELAIPVLKDMSFAKVLDFSLATRYSDYSNFGNTTNSKFGFRWKPIDDLLIRGSYSEGFRAPSVAELFTGQAENFPQITDPCATTVQGQDNDNVPAACAGVPVYDQANSQIKTTVGGNPDLKPESSTSKTFGFVYSPSFLPGLDLSLDWWKIDIKTAILTLPEQTILDGCYRSGVLSDCALISRDPSGAISNIIAIPQNIGTYSSEGYDLTVGYHLPEQAWGKLSVVWDTSYLANVQQDLNGDGVVSQDPVSGEGGNQVGKYLGRGANNWRIRSNVQARWERGNLGATWLVRYFSAQDEPCASIAKAQLALLCSDQNRFTNLDGDDPGTAPDGPTARPQNRLSATIYNDLSFYVKMPWNARVTLGVNNAFGEDPPRSAISFANSFDPAYEIPGRFYYMQYTQKF